MATAREKLAALRKSATGAAGVTGAVSLGVDSPVTSLPAQQGGAAEVKRRAAAGEPIVQSGLRRATAVQEGDAIAAGALGGVVEGVLGLPALLTDAVTMNVRGPRAGLKALREGKGIGGARQAIQDAALALPATRAVGALGDAVETGMRRASNVPDEVATSGAAPFVRLGVDVAIPGPELAAVARKGGAVARVTDELVDAAKVVDDVPASAVDPETARLVEEAGRAQEAARIQIKAEPKPEVSLSRMIADELDARDRTAATEPGGTLADDVNAKKKLRDQLFAHDEAVKAAEAEHLAAVKAADERMARTEATPFGKRPRNAVVVDGESAEFVTPKRVDEMRREMVEPTQQKLAKAKADRDAFQQSLSKPGNLLDELSDEIRRAPSASDKELTDIVRRVAARNGVEIPADRPVVFYRAIPAGEGNANLIELPDGTVRPYTFTQPGQIDRPRGLPLSYGGKNPTLARIIDPTGTWEDTGHFTGQSPGGWNEAVNPYPVSVRRVHEEPRSLPQLFSQVGRDDLTFDDGVPYPQRTYVVDPTRPREVPKNLGPLVEDARFLKNMRELADVMKAAPNKDNAAAMAEHARRWQYFRRVMDSDAETVINPDAATELRAAQKEIGAIVRKLREVADGQVEDLNWTRDEAADAVRAFDDAAPPAGDGPTPPATPPPDAPDGSGGANGPDPLGKYARPSAINLERLNATDEAKRFIDDTAKSVDDPTGGNIAEDLTAIKGEPLTHAEVKAAQARGKLLTEPDTRDATLDLAADILHSRNRLVEMAEAGRVTPEYLALQKAVSTKATQLGRLLNTLGIRAGDEALSATAIKEVTEQLEALGKTSDEIVEALKDVDFSDPAQATRAFQQHIKPKWGDLLDAYRYTNLLSSPRTHIVNLTSNLMQATITRPADLLASGAVDWLGSKLTGNARTRYVSDVKPYYRGLVGAYPKAAQAFFGVVTGRVPIKHLDLAGRARMDALPAPLKVVPRLLSGIDEFTVTLIEGGEMQRLVDIERKAGRVVNEADLAKKAMSTAEEYAFRKQLQPSEFETVPKIDKATGKPKVDSEGRPVMVTRFIPNENGRLLSVIDDFTSRISHVLNTRVGGIQPLRWAVPFIQTPMNIFKAGIEHSPLGFATTFKSTRKTEQLGKAITGSAVFMGAGVLALSDRTTWSAPRNPKDRAAFYAAGYQPYSLKVGDKWISYTKLGPLAYPIAMAAAMKHQAYDHPEATGKMNAALTGRIISSLGEFFSDQSYMQGIGDLITAAKGDESVLAKMLSNYASQLVPLSSLQRWVTQIIDPVYRKSSREFSFEGIMQNLKRGIPFASETVPPQLTPNKQPSVRQMPWLNAVSPVGITTEIPSGVREYRGLQQRRRNAAIRKRAQEKQP